MTEIMVWLIDTARDPVKGPKLVLGLIAFAFFWIALMQSIGADLWSEVPRFDNPVSTYEVTK